MLVEGMEVMVKSFLVSGKGKIKNIADDPTFPVQVELDEADQDGHKVYRFSSAEVTPLEIEKKPAVVEEDQAPEIQAVKLDKIIGGYSLEVGECFTAKQKSKSHYWIYSSGKLRGCFPAKHFSMITLEELERQEAAKEIASVIVQDIVTVAALEEAEQREKELKEQAKKKKKKPKPKKLTYRQLEELGQTNIFEFI